MTWSTLFGDGDVLPRELFRMARHDFNTFTHVTNVASYCVMLAKKLGINDDNELRKIATAAILHDLGKRFIPSRILTKTTKLTAGGTRNRRVAPDAWLRRTVRKERARFWPAHDGVSASRTHGRHRIPGEGSWRRNSSLGADAGRRRRVRHDDRQAAGRPAGHGRACAGLSTPAGGNPF